MAVWCPGVPTRLRPRQQPLAVDMPFAVLVGQLATAYAKRS